MLLDNYSWPDYQLVDSGNGRKLEKFGRFYLNRPSPICTWQPQLSSNEWLKADAIFKISHGSKTGEWQIKSQMPEIWPIKWQNLTINCSLLPFGHTGIFPEQASHWLWLTERVSQANKIKQPQILNLFGYTGVASLACAAAGAKVTHVDSSYPAIGKARANQTSSGLSDMPIRWIKEDVLKYVSRELNRGTRYDGIIMDPPKFGHGPHGEIWSLSKSFPQLLKICEQLLSQQPLFVLINAYAFDNLSQLKKEINPYFRSLSDAEDWEYGQLKIEEKSQRKYLHLGWYAKWETK